MDARDTDTIPKVRSLRKPISEDAVTRAGTPPSRNVRGRDVRPHCSRSRQIRREPETQSLESRESATEPRSSGCPRDNRWWVGRERSRGEDSR